MFRHKEETHWAEVEAENSLVLGFDEPRHPDEIVWEKDRAEVDRRQREAERYEAECGHLHRPSEHYDPAEDQIMEWYRGEYENPERRGRLR